MFDPQSDFGSISAPSIWLRISDVRRDRCVYMHSGSRCSRALHILGATAMVIGALDPLEGSIVVVAGSALLLVSEFSKDAARRHLGFWTSVFAFVVVGVTAMFGLSSVGGIGGNSGRSIWWGILILPYPVGWLLGVGRLVAEAIRALRHRSASRGS